MTKESFSLLEPDEQEQFVLSGQKFEQVESVNDEGLVAPIVTASIPSEPGSRLNGESISGMMDSSAQSVPSIWSEGFDIKDPVELLYLLDDEVRLGKANGGIDLHPWQIQFMLDFAEGNRTQSNPFQAEVRACNGSGKDKIVVSACAVWLLMRYSYARAVITSASGQQLSSQTEKYIKMLCINANSKFGMDVWKTNQRYYECLVTHSPMNLFATDEPGKAEGYHPLTANAKMAIFTSESKSIPDEIFLALERCTGYTHRVDVSTPGPRMGYFFNTCSIAISRKNIKNVFDVKPEDFIEYHIQASDCPHITVNVIEKLKRTIPGGENSAVFKSIVYAEFGLTEGELIVIPHNFVWKAYSEPVKEGWLREPFNKGGLDLSDGGDETVLVVRNGNKHIATIPFRFDNTEDTISFLQEKFKEWHLDVPEAFIYADVGGLGAPMLNALKRLGWSNIRFVDNRNTPYYPKTYKNRGAELWFHLRQLFERHEIILIYEATLVRQLSTRYYKILPDNRHQLVSKLESRSKGYPSPDRADAFTLAFWDYKSTKDYTDEYKEKHRPYKEEKEIEPVGDFTIKGWAQGNNKKFSPRMGRHDFGALQYEFARYQERKQLVNK